MCLVAVAEVEEVQGAAAVVEAATQLAEEVQGAAVAEVEEGQGAAVVEAAPLVPVRQVPVAAVVEAATLHPVAAIVQELLLVAVAEAASSPVKTNWFILAAAYLPPASRTL